MAHKVKLFYAVEDRGDGTTKTSFFTSEEKWNAFCDENEKYGNILEARWIFLHLDENGILTNV